MSHPSSDDTVLPTLHPHRARMVEAGLAMLPYARDAALAALDLGVGSGLFAQQFLATFPNATLIGVDAAPDAGGRTRTRLGAVGERADIRIGDFRDLRSLVSPWERGQVVLSLHTLHRLARSEKLELMARSLQFLEPGGWWLNADTVGVASPFIASRFEALRVEGIVRRAGWHDARFKDATAARTTLAELERHDDARLTTVADELALLGSAGFAHADIVWLDHREAVTVAVKA